MSSLQRMLQLQKAKENKSEAPASAPDVRDSQGAEPQAVVHDEPDQSDSVPPAEAPAPATAKPAGLKLNMLGAARRVGADGSAGASNARNANSESKPANPRPVASDSSADGSVEFDLADLARFDESTTPALTQTRSSEFLDEIEATAPERALAPDLTAQQIGFVEQLDGIYQILNDPELFAQSIRIVMMELQENPEYVKLVSDQDVHTMIRGMRNSMGLARIKKQEKSRKAGTATKKAARGKSAEMDAALSVLDSLGFDADD